MRPTTEVKERRPTIEVKETKETYYREGQEEGVVVEQRENDKREQTHVRAIVHAYTHRYTGKGAVARGAVIVCGCLGVPSNQLQRSERLLQQL